VETEKGTQLTEPEVAILRERVAAAHAWLETYAPESARIAIQDELPGAAAEMTDDMRRYLRAVAIAAETLPEYPDGAQWQNLLFDAAVGLGMRTNRDSFAAIYRAFIGRDSGPRAGWLLASLDKDFVVRRLLEAADATPVTNGAPS
jgi:lysyl-tRNA synthetase class 1